MKNSLVFIPFNVLLEDVCNYSEETTKILVKNNKVVGMALGNPFSPWKDFLGFIRGIFIISVSKSYTVYRPVMFFPFQRLDFVKRINILINIIFLNLRYIFYKNKILWFFEPVYQSLFIRFLIYQKSLFDCIDHFSSHPEMKKEHFFALKNVDYVDTNSKILKKRYQHIRSDIRAVEAGFALDSMPKFDFKIKKNKTNKTFFFVGSIGWRMDFKFIKTLMAKRKTDNFIFIGPEYFDLSKKRERKLKNEFDKLLKDKRISWLGELPRKEIIKKIANYDVGVIPYKSSLSFNRFSFPMKLMEYFYLGMPVLSTDIKELERFPESVYIPEISGWRGLNKFLASDNLANKKLRRKVSVENSWNKKVKSIFDFLAD